MRNSKRTPPEKRESLTDYKYNLRELAKKSLKILKQNETKNRFTYLKIRKNENSI